MEEQIAKDLIIPNEDRKFLLLPDMQEKTFLDIGGLKDYVQNEIARWTNVDATIENKYKSVLSKIGVVAKDAKEGCIASGALAEVKKLLQEWSANGNGVNSCVNSNSRFGQYLRELKARNLAPQFFRDCSLLAMVVLDYPLPQIQFNSQVFPLAIEAARIAKYFACPEDLSQKIATYESRLQTLTNSADEQTRDYEVHRQKLQNLEDAYSKKLQLEGPAQHWKNLSRFYLGWGWGLLVLSLVLGGVAIGGLFWLLVQADAIVIFNENKLSLSTIRASLILIAATSMAGYLLHLFTKLAISCFHLSRDYRERFQLTNVFLAFLRDGDVKCDDQVKQIVMQALFSRSDTGLLKGEHSFKMPGVADLVRKEES
jgi:hypothetical protein